MTTEETKLIVQFLNQIQLAWALELDEKVRATKK